MNYIKGIGYSIRKFSFNSRKSLNVLKYSSLSLQNNIKCSAIYRDMNIISGSEDSYLRIWDSETGKCKQILEGHTGSITCVSTFKHTIISGSTDHNIRVWSEDSNGDFSCDHILYGHTTPISCVHIIHSDTNPQIISGSSDGTIILWDNSIIPKFILKNHTSSITSIKFISKTKFITESTDNTVKIFDLTSLQPDTEIHQTPHFIDTTILFSNNIRLNMYLL